jgi:hypothetical protein
LLENLSENIDSNVSGIFFFFFFVLFFGLCGSLKLCAERAEEAVLTLQKGKSLYDHRTKRREYLEHTHNLFEQVLFISFHPQNKFIYFV